VIILYGFLTLSDPVSSGCRAMLIGIGGARSTQQNADHDHRHGSSMTTSRSKTRL
jgi:hypothetical protein